MNLLTDEQIQSLSPDNYIKYRIIQKKFNKLRDFINSGCDRSNKDYVKYEDEIMIGRYLKHRNPDYEFEDYDVLRNVLIMLKCRAYNLVDPVKYSLGDNDMRILNDIYEHFFSDYGKHLLYYHDDS